jgi:hypothetical protein
MSGRRVAAADESADPVFPVLSASRMQAVPPRLHPLRAPSLNPAPRLRVSASRICLCPLPFAFVPRFSSTPSLRAPSLNPAPRLRVNTCLCPLPFTFVPRYLRRRPAAPSTLRAPSLNPLRASASTLASARSRLPSFRVFLRRRPAAPSPPPRPVFQPRSAPPRQHLPLPAPVYLRSAFSTFDPR